MQSVGSDYEFGSDLIGHGAFAVVYKGRQKSTGQPVAVKQILLKNIPGKLSNMRQKEIAILKDLKHANIVQLFDCYETKVELYLIMEFCNGGDLADYLQDKKTLSEDSIKHLSRHIAAALLFIHQHHIIHRDIKPQNVLLTFQTGASKLFKEAIIKIADFGFARHLSEADMAATICGSPIYMAPEILIGHRYDSKVDMWSTGVILYQCLTGSTPFRANDPHSLRKQYIRNPLIPQIPPGTSSLLSDLLLRLIKKSPQERINQDEFKSHSFLQIHARAQEEDSPSLHAKSSPVPISRPQVNTHSGYSSSPKTSPQSSRMSYGSLKGFSASSGPPSIQRIVTNSSLQKYFSSPPTNVTDEGFVLVGKLGRQQRSSFSSCSTEGSIGSSPHTSLSPHGSLTNYTNLSYSPHPPPPPQDHPTSAHSGSSQEPGLLSHTPPFSSLFKTGGLQSSVKGSAQKHALQTTPPNYSYSPDSSLRSPSFSSSPGRKSLPSSHSGSHNKLSTLVESHHEGSNYMIDSTDMITPSLLLESDVLRDELERLSNPGHTSQGSLFSILKNSPQKDEDLRVRNPNQKGLNLSQELADIRKKDISLNQKRSALFQIGDSKEEDLSPVGERSGWRGGTSGSSGSNASSPVGTEEMFSLQLEDEGDSSLYLLQQNSALANELLRIARTRQGPMLLLSSSMGDSGGMLDHVVRFSEQLVLCTKAATVIRDGIRQYNIGNAVTSSDPSDAHKTALAEAERLESHCMDKARIARDLYQKCLAKRRRHSLPPANVTAERLIFAQAADMCKQALLEEKNGRREECLRKYRLACLLLKLLQSDAKSPADRNTLQKYISLVRYRQQTLTSPYRS